MEVLVIRDHQTKLWSFAAVLLCSFHILLSNYQLFLFFGIFRIFFLQSSMVVLYILSLFHDMACKFCLFI